MAPRPFRFMCPGCALTKSNQPGHYYCSYCDQQNRAINTIAQHVRNARVRLRGEGNTYVFAALWVVFCEREYGPEHALTAKARELLKRAREPKQLTLAPVFNPTEKELHDYF